MEEISKRYLSGETCSSLSRHYGTNKKTITDHLKRYGIAIRPRSRTFCMEEAKRLYSTGHTCEQIAKILKVTEWAINHGLKKDGVKMRDNYHPDRIEQSRRLMGERMENFGNIRVGKHEPNFCKILKEKFGTVSPQHKIEMGGHHFDAFAGGILWELDEKEHQTSKHRKTNDIKYDSRAKELGYEVRHVWEWDFLQSGIDKWHHVV